MPNSNITLIGMPGSGKSTVGVVLARAGAMSFLDSDRLIERVEGKKLFEISDAVGLKGFREVENRVNASIDAENTVIATGGSVIYGPEAMAHLRDISHVVYLCLPYPAIEARLGDLHARGVSIAPGQTLLDLYNERCPLYEKYAHFAVDCEGLRPREIAAIILERTGRDAPGLFAPSDAVE